MNILYLIGNGFDIAQGYDTSYNAFYKYLQDYSDNDKLIKNMLAKINTDNTINWSDMETALGVYTKEFEDEANFRDLYFKIKDLLQKFLIEKDRSFILKESMVDKYYRDLVRPDTYLNMRQQQEIDTYFNRFPTELKYLSIASFNYTFILENSLGDIANMNSLPTNGHKYKFTNFIKIHGDIDSEMLMGVDSDDQIGNSTFKGEEDFEDYFVKPKDNHELGSLVDAELSNRIKAANLIVSMGISFGPTDGTWWRLIGTELRNRQNLILIINDHDDAPESTRLSLQAGIKRRKINNILSRCGMNDDECDKYRSRVYMALNENFLQPKPFAEQDNRVGR